MRDPDKCAHCGGPVPTYVYGKGEWLYIPTLGGGTIERGPYCDRECMDQAREESRLRSARAAFGAT